MPTLVEDFLRTTTTKPQIDMKNTESWLTANALAAVTRAEHRHVTKWMDAESIPSKQMDGHTVYERTAAIAVIESHQKPETENPGPDLDPETGLSWSKARLREQTLDSRAGRAREKALAGGELVPIAVVGEALRLIGGAFDRLGHEMYILDVPLAREHDRAVVQRLADRAKADFQSYINSWLARQAELQKEGGLNPKPVDFR